MTPASPALPPDVVLEEALIALASKRDHPGVIRVFEAWHAGGQPTSRGRLTVARALFDLRMLDRAALRARELVEASQPPDVEALELLAEIYLERGWTARAQALLSDLAALDPERASRLRARDTNLTPENDARRIEREGTLDDLVRLAERFCATGSFVRARGILERIRRQRPDHARASALLWGLNGDLTVGPPLWELWRTAVPVLNLPELAEEPEHTESVDASERTRLLAELADDVADRNFPSLFKQGEPPPPTEESAELTAATAMATQGQLREAPIVEDTDARLVNLGGGGSGDTQILLVLRPGEDISAHRRREESDRLRETLNLREYQASMGMTSDSDVGDGFEEEDESVVMLARSEAPISSANPSSNAPIRVQELHPTPPTPAPAPPPPLPPPRRHVHPLWFGGALLILLLFALAAMALVIPALLASSRSTARVQFLNAVASDELAQLVQAEHDLEARGAHAELADLRLIIWSEFDGEPTRLTLAREGMDADRFDVHRRAMLAARAALVLGDVGGAAAAVVREPPTDDEERLLLARIAMGEADPDRANDILADLDAPGAPRYRLARASALAAAGLAGPALALVGDVLAADPDHARARVLAIALSPSPAVGEAARSLLADGSLPPRFVGAAFEMRVNELLLAGVPARAGTLAREGLQRDGQNLSLKLVVADAARESGDLQGALAELDSTAAKDERIWVASVLTLVDLDRLDEASERVTARASRSPEIAQVLRAIVAASSGSVETVPQGAPTVLRQAALALGYAAALNPDALVEVRALRTMSVPVAPGSGFEEALRRRALALEALLVPPEALAKVADNLVRCCGGDAWTHIYLGRAWERAGERVLAAQHFDRAVQVGPAIAMGWYERGRFYEDAGDPVSRSAQSWHSFLALAPSGARAVRVAERIAEEP